MNIQKYWMVHRWNGKAPTTRHATFYDAKREAERLTLKEHVTFVVLEAVSVCEPVNPKPVIWSDIPDPLPF